MSSALKEGRRPALEVASSDVAITVRGLTKRYGDHLAVSDLSFDVGWGKVTGFLGPNGAGKSTTLRMILGLASPTGGRAEIAGRRFTELGDPTTMVGAILDGHGAHPRRSGRAHLRIVADVTGTSRARVDEVLAMVDLTDAASRKVGKYSLGMKQRLGLAAAILNEPRLLILDEPANGLDPAGIRWLRDFMKAYARRGNAVLVSSHLLGEIAQMADDVIVINKGKLVAEGPIETLTGGLTAKVRVRTPELDRLTRSLSARGASVDSIGTEELLVTGSTMETVGRVAAGEAIPIFELATEGPTLEDLFFQLTTKEVTR